MHEGVNGSVVVVGTRALYRECFVTWGDYEEFAQYEAAMDAKILEYEHGGGSDSFKAGLYATLRPFEARFWFWKAVMMLEKVPLAFYVISSNTGGSTDDSNNDDNGISVTAICVDPVSDNCRVDSAIPFVYLPFCRFNYSFEK